MNPKINGKTPQLMKVEIRLKRLNDEVVLTSNYIWLDPHAPNTGRKFVFSGIESKRDLIHYDDEIRITITTSDKMNQQFKYQMFDLYVVNYDRRNLTNEWWVYGDVCSCGMDEYRQAMVDLLSLWQKGNAFDWFAYANDSPLREEYFTACRKYSRGPSTKLVEKDIYQFDVSKIREDVDFFYLAGLELIGEKGYMGYDLHTYKDCLAILYNNNSKEYFDHRKIIFNNVGKIQNDEMMKFYDEIKNLFLLKFIVEENQ